MRHFIERGDAGEFAQHFNEFVISRIPPQDFEMLFGITKQQAQNNPQFTMLMAGQPVYEQIKQRASQNQRTKFGEQQKTNAAQAHQAIESFNENYQNEITNYFGALDQQSMPPQVGKMGRNALIAIHNLSQNYYLNDYLKQIATQVSDQVYDEALAGNSTEETVLY